MKNIQSLLPQISIEQLRKNLFYLAQAPLPCRTLNFTRPGQTQCTLYEADAFIEKQLSDYGYPVVRESVPVQAFRFDASVPHKFQKPQPEDPWYPAFNLYARKTGAEFPDELIIVLAHKDSQSWLERAPGACDNAVGTVSVLEIARVLKNFETRRSLWFLFCNEEHWPWTSVTAAEKLANSNFEILAVFNQDGPGCKAAHQKSPQNVTRYSTPEGKKIADLLGKLNEEFGIGLAQSQYFQEHPNDDDGSFVKAGIPPAVLNIGSMPYAEPFYHTVQDIPEHVDLKNAALTTQLCLAGILHLDQLGKI
jgi:hypothetical protein